MSVFSGFRDKLKVITEEKKGVDSKKKSHEPKYNQKSYLYSDLIFRLDNQTGELCLYTFTSQRTGKAEVYVIETNIKNKENVIEWIGRPLPARPKLSRNYINKDDFERYGCIYHREDIFDKYVNKEHDENHLYTEEELVELINSINKKRKIEIESVKGEGR